jgi:predicted transcriptional regulator
MGRPKSSTLTGAEQRIMEVLWRRGPSTVRQVKDGLTNERPAAYTTVMTVLGVLQAKGFVRAEASGRAHVYSALVDQQEARNAALNQLVGQFFGGSREALALHLTGGEPLSEAALRRLEDQVRDDSVE